MLTQRQLKAQIFVDGYLQGTCLALAVFAGGEAVFFAAFHSLWMLVPTLAVLALSVIFEQASRRIAAYKYKLQILEVAAKLAIPPPNLPRNKTPTYTVKYKPRGNYPK